MRYREIYRAYSMNNGIAFYSSCHKGYLSIATLEGENIHLKWRKKKKKRIKKFSIDKICHVFLFLLLYYLILMLGINIVITEGLEWGIRFCLIAYAFAITARFILVSKLKARKKKELLKYHSAEHMVLNAYRDLKRIPSLKEIRSYSRYSNSCSTNKKTRVIFMLLIMFVATFISNKFICGAVIVLSYQMADFIVRQGYLNFMQYFTTDTPRIKHLILAIEGLNYWLENEQG